MEIFTSTEGIVYSLDLYSIAWDIDLQNKNYLFNNFTFYFQNHAQEYWKGVEKFKLIGNGKAPSFDRRIVVTSFYGLVDKNASFFKISFFEFIMARQKPKTFACSVFFYFSFGWFQNKSY